MYSSFCKLEKNGFMINFDINFNKIKMEIKNIKKIVQSIEV